jgi:hypothetical protein
MMQQFDEAKLALFTTFLLNKSSRYDLEGSRKGLVSLNFVLGYILTMSPVLEFKGACLFN